jgi:hypothetical protein
MLIPSALAVAVAAFGASDNEAMASAGKQSATRPTITVRVDDKRITAATQVPAGLVDFHIVTSGKVHHHLAFWHLNGGVTARHFIRVLKASNGDPFKIAIAIGGNGPMLSGSFDETMRLVPGTVVFADIVEGPTTRIATFRVSGSAVSTHAPAAVGTVVNRGYRFLLPAHFGRPGVYRFTNPDPVAHDGVIFQLLNGKTASDLVHFIRSGGKGRPPVDFSKPLGGPGVIGAHWTSWFRLRALPPGRYVLGCFLPDPAGQLHVADGMAADFVVH